MLVARGLLSEEQLTAALVVQQASGEPLGEILVSRGYVPAPVVARALATQHGGVLKTEYGYALGFDSQLAPAPYAEPPLSPAPARSRADRRLADDLDRPSGAPSPLDRSSGLELELADAQRENRELRRKIAELEQKAAALAAERDAAVRDSAVATARLGGFEAAVAALRAQRAAGEQS